MSNNWKYSSLTQRERLKLIGNGNGDVYNTEKENNRVYKNQLIDAGLDTTNIDLWDKAVDNAYNKATDPRRVVDRGQPKFMSYGKSMRIKEYNDYIKNLKKTAQENNNKALENAINSTNALEEWLANNGYSQDGSYAKKEYANISRNLSDTLEKIVKDYKNGIKYAKEKLL